MTTSLPRRIDASEARVGDLIQRQKGEAVVRDRVFRVSDAGVAYGAGSLILCWEGCTDSDWELWLLDRPETTTERFTREALAKTGMGPRGARIVEGALEAMWSAGWTVSPPADAEPEGQ